jgi:CRISPR-associated protein Cas2
MLIVAAYDITSDRRRRKVYEALKDFGLPVQYSIVECDLDPQRFAALKARVLPLIRKSEDRICFYRLCRECELKTEAHGISRNPFPKLP